MVVLFLFLFSLLLSLSDLPQLETGPTKINGPVCSDNSPHASGPLHLYMQYRDGMNGRDGGGEILMQTISMGHMYDCYIHSW